MFKRIPSAPTKADSNMQPIAPTSSPTIGNTLVVGSQSPPEKSINELRELCPKVNGQPIIALDTCFLINPNNNKQSMAIKVKDAISGYTYDDYLANEQIEKRLFERE